MLSEATLREALRDCYDPMIPLNVVDLGLIQSISLLEDPNAPGAGIPGVPTRFRVNIALVSASSDEDQQAKLLAQIHNRLAGIPGISGIHLDLLTQPAWTPSHITPAGRHILKLDQPAFPILNNRVR